MNKKRIKYIAAALIYLAIMVIVILFSAKKSKESILNKSQIAFSTAIKKEKKLFISKIHIRYNSAYSPDSISGEEKQEWTSQFFLTTKDSCRHRLDSLFQEEMNTQRLNLQTAISYTYCGVSASSKPKEFIEKATLIQAGRYRKEYNKGTDFILNAYIYLPFYLLLNNPIVYLLIGINLLGAAGYMYLKKRLPTQYPTTSIPPVMQARETDTTQWIILKDGYLWDEYHHCIRQGEHTLVLTGESLRFFRLFLQKETFTLHYADIYPIYGMKEESPSIKDRIYHSVRQLKKDLEPVGIQVRSVRGEGYGLVFKQQENSPE